MFALPDYWWLLALAVIPQAVFAVVLAISRSSGTSTHAASDAISRRVVPVWAIILLCIGAVIGVGYGIVQHDGVFVLGQVCVLLVALIRNRLIRQQMETNKTL